MAPEAHINAQAAITAMESEAKIWSITALSGMQKCHVSRVAAHADAPCHPAEAHRWVPASAPLIPGHVPSLEPRF